MRFVCLPCAARSTPNLCGSMTDEMDLDASGKVKEKSDKDTSGLPAVVRVPSLEDDWLTSFFARQPITDVDRRDVTVNDFDILTSSATLYVVTSDAWRLFFSVFRQFSSEELPKKLW